MYSTIKVMRGLPTLSIVLFLCWLSVGDAARILLFFSPTKSQLLNGANMATILANDGHDVTLVLPWNDEPDIIKSYKYSLLFYNTSMSREQEQSVFMGVTETSAEDVAVGKVPPSVGTLFGERCRGLLFDEELHEKISQLKPQLAVVNGAMACVIAHLDRIRVPFLDYCSFPLIHTLCGYPHRIPAPPSYVPDGFFSEDVHRSFFKRVLNSLVYILGPKLMPLLVFKQTEEMISQYQSKYRLPTKNVYELRSGASFVLVNGDVTFESIRPLLPKVVHIGGIQCVEPKPLQGALKEFVSESEPAGIIVFSIGAVIETVPHHFLEMFMDIFQELPQRVVWKLRNVPQSVKSRTPPNIKFVEWLPQQDLLGHPLTKLFITHGGIQGSFESICHGKPSLGIDFNLDQVSNIMILVNKGMTLHAGNSKSLIKDDLSMKINMLLTDPEYAKNAVKAQTLFYDKPQTAAQRLTYAVNYTLRHKGAYHLTSNPGLHQHWFQYYSFDVTIFLLVVFVFVFVMVFLIFKCCFSLFTKLCSKKSKLKDN